MFILFVAILFRSSAASRKIDNIIIGGEKTRRQLSSNSSNTAVTFVKNSMCVPPLEKRTNESEQVEIATIPIPEDHQNLSTNAMSSLNTPDPGLVEKLMQQLNDLKELVCI